MQRDPGRWRRRARTIPAMLGVTVFVVASAPITLPLATIVDIARGQRRLPTVRGGLFALRYLVNDSAEIVLAPLLWLASNGNDDRGIERYRSVQVWSIRSLAAAADRFIGVRIDPTATVPVAEGAGPLIVLVRHCSMLDSSVPSLVFGLDSPWVVRSIVTTDALADPGFDLIYPALGTVFIDRDEGATSRLVIGEFARHGGPNDVATIYPEGNVFRPSLLVRSLERLAERAPERAARLTGLRHVLPPRPGGTLALLRALPAADVVVIGHVGFERAATLAEMAASAPLDSTVQLMIRHVPRSSIPSGEDDRIAWLDALWLDLDQWIDDQLNTSHRPADT